MEFLKKNYEKVLLGVVLLGLTAAVASLPFIIKAKQDRLRTLSELRTHPRVKPLPDLNLAVEDKALQQAQSKVQLDFTGGHNNLFNPVEWRKYPDGRLVKIEREDQMGPEALQILNIKPLYLQLTYNPPSASGYPITVDQPATGRAAAKHTQTIVARENNKSDLFNLQEVVGPPEKPTELVLVWRKTGEAIHLPTDKPYRQVEDYTADLKYRLEPNRPPWTDRRVGSELFFNNQPYKIVVIDSNSVVVSAPNGKKTTITFNPAKQ